MSDQYTTDAFVCCAIEDREWVETWLRPRLEAANLRLALSYELPPGTLRPNAIETAIVTSRRTVVVLSPAWLQDEWKLFEGALAATVDPAALRRQLLPVLLKAIEEPLPRAIAIRVPLDFRDRKRWPAETRRLAQALTEAIPLPAPWRASNGPLRVQIWQRWLWRYRRRVVLAGIAGTLAVMLVLMALEIGPFARRLVWVPMPKAPGVTLRQATALAVAGDALIAAGETPDYDCEQTEFGLWRWSPLVELWQVADDASRISLCVEVAGKEKGIVNVIALSRGAGNATLAYAATDGAGLLVSRDRGASWARLGGAAGPAEIVALTSDVVADGVIYVAQKGHGLYRYDSAPSQWAQLDARPEAQVCADGFALTRTLVVGALVSTPGGLIVGTGESNLISNADTPSGLYLSQDRGECWVELETVYGRWYHALVGAPDAPSNTVLAITRDGAIPVDDERTRVQRYDLSPATRGQSPKLLLKQTNWLYALAVQHDRWISAGQNGAVIEGSVNEAGAHLLATVPGCSVFLGCEVALAWDPDKSYPMLLVSWIAPFSDRGNVYQLEPGEWWRAVLPLR